PQGLAGLDPELLGEGAARLVVDIQRLGIAARAIEGEHQLPAWALAQWPFGDQRLELRDHAVDVSQRERGFRTLLADRGHELVERRQRDCRERSVEQIVERLPAPQLERLIERQAGGGHVAAGQAPPAAVEQLL